MLGLIPTELHPYTVADFFRSISVLWRSRLQENQIILPELGKAVPIRSARAAVIVAIKALGLRVGSRIGVPLYCCPVVFKAIKEAGCYPRFLDIDPTTFCLSPEDLLAKRSEIDSVIAVHMFGHVCDMPKVLETMRGLPVIEDCAQSIGSRLDGRVTGSFGTISFFSFRSGKYLSVGEGGALYTRDSDLQSRISELVSDLPAPRPAQETRHILETYIRSKLRSKPLWGLLGARVWRIYNKKTDFLDKSPIVLGAMFKSDLATTNRRMPLLDSLIAKQRAHADYYEQHLQIDPAEPCFQRPGTFYNRLMYPITFPSSEQRDFMAIFLRRHSIGTATPYEDVIKGAATNYCYEGDCPMAERVLRSTLIVPCYSKLKPLEVRRITRIMNIGWAKISGKSRT